MLTLPRALLLPRPSLHGHYPTSQLFRPRSQITRPLPPSQSRSLRHTRPAGQETCMIRLATFPSLCLARRRLRPRGRRECLVSCDPPSLACGSLNTIGPSHIPLLSGLTTGFSVLRFTSQSLPLSLLLSSALGVEFPFSGSFDCQPGSLLLLSRDYTIRPGIRLVD